MNGSDVFGNLLLGLSVLFVLFIIFREILCWYWKVNEVVGLLKEIRDKLDRQPSIVAMPPQAGYIPSTPAGNSDIVVCRKCTATYQRTRAPRFCEHCGEPIV